VQRLLAGLAEGVLVFAHRAGVGCRAGVIALETPVPQVTIDCETGHFAAGHPVGTAEIPGAVVDRYLAGEPERRSDAGAAARAETAIDDAGIDPALPRNFEVRAAVALAIPTPAADHRVGSRNVEKAGSVDIAHVDPVRRLHGKRIGRLPVGPFAAEADAGL